MTNVRKETEPGLQTYCFLRKQRSLIHAKTMGKRPNKRMNTLNEQFRSLFLFLTDGIWRITENEVTGFRERLYNLIKVIILSVRRYKEDELQNKASALTYYTLLSIVPILAMFFAIARGFGLQEVLEQELAKSFEAQSDVLIQVTQFVNSYLEHTKNGVFIGIGIIFLFWAAMSLIGTIEASFNSIWQVKKGRSVLRKITDYFSMLLILPVLIISSSGLSIFLSTKMADITMLQFASPFIRQLLSFTPYVLTWITFTCIYIFLPNTKVKIKNALLSGIVTGTAFQLFQFVYIHGQIGVSKYDAIYGSFAALPLLLLWLQLSWLIVLFGAELAFAGQNIENYAFENDSRRISRRYNDYLILIIASIIVKRFEKGETPYSAEDISKESRIPIRLTRQILNLLTEANLIIEVNSPDERSIHYQPALDISNLSIGYLFSKIDKFGSENFKVDKNIFNKQWKKLIDSKELILKNDSQILLKDL